MNFLFDPYYSNVITIISTIISTASALFFAWYIRFHIKTTNETVFINNRLHYSQWLFSDLSIYDIWFSGLYEYVEKHCGELHDNRKELREELESLEIINNTLFSKTCKSFLDSATSSLNDIFEQQSNSIQFLGQDLILRVRSYIISSNGYMENLGHYHIHYVEMLQSRLDAATNLVSYLKTQPELLEVGYVKKFITKWEKYSNVS